jgi:hypothetical protein
MPPLFERWAEPFGALRDQKGMSTLPIAADHLFLQFAVAFALCALACGLILAGRLSIRRAADSEGWPAVQGMVIESTVAAQRDDGKQLYRPIVRYRYEVAGERYEGDRIQWAAPRAYRKYTRARRVLDRYRFGHAVAVHYDPKRPGIAVLRSEHAVISRSILVLAPTAALYVVFIASALFIGH